LCVCVCVWNPSTPVQGQRSIARGCSSATQYEWQPGVIYLEATGNLFAKEKTKTQQRNAKPRRMY
jgi:hypothetical protein